VSASSTTPAHANSATYTTCDGFRQGFGVQNCSTSPIAPIRPIAPPDVVLADSVLGAPVSALKADVTLEFNDQSGFVTRPEEGDFHFKVRIQEPGGALVTCLEYRMHVEGGEGGSIAVRNMAPAPAMSMPGLILGVLVLTGVGVLALARRRVRSSGESR
jgi:hypothetical protein